jgi:hypothetical protein
VKHLAAIVCLSLCTSCSKESPPKIEGLQFPVVILFGNSATRVFKDHANLTMMHTNYVVLSEATPMLIDSQFKIYAVERLRSTHNDMWLMAHPSGLTEVTFELKAHRSGREAARELFTRQLEKQTWLVDLDERRHSLGAKQSLPEMVAVVQSQSQ